VTVGPIERLEITRIECGAPNWCGAAPTADSIRALAQVRAHAEPVACLARTGDGRLVVELDCGLAGVAAGQTLVLYDGDRVLGSATIDRAT
jgi:tRNA-specific 2-thiouridylase